VADTTNAASEPRYKLPCEFCGSELKVSESEVLKSRVACESCRARVQWCPECSGFGCDRCGHEGLDAKSGCQLTGSAYCEPETGCESCRLRLIDRSIEQAEDRADHAREIGWAR